MPFLKKETTTKLSEQWKRTMGTKLFVISKMGEQWGTNILHTSKSRGQ
jgi:hypothetical protein